MGHPKKQLSTAINAKADGANEQPVLESRGNGEMDAGGEKLEQNRNKRGRKSNNKIIQSLNLPVICNMNPRSVYNKIDEFHEFVKEEQVDIHE